MWALGDIGNVVIFQYKLWHFVSGSQRKHHLSSPITVFLKSMLFLSGFLWNTRTNAKPFNSPLVIQIHGTDFFFFFLSLTLCSSRPSGHVSCSRKSTCLPALVPLLESQLLPLSRRCHWLTVSWMVFAIICTLFNLQGHTLTSGVSYVQSHRFLCIYNYVENWLHMFVDVLHSNYRSTVSSLVHSDAFLCLQGCWDKIGLTTLRLVLSQVKTRCDLLENTRTRTFNLQIKGVGLKSFQVSLESFMLLCVAKLKTLLFP